MGLVKDRTRQHVRGLGNLEIRQVLPAPAAAFDNAGYLDEAGTDIVDDYVSEELTDENGNLVNVLEKSHKATLQTNLSQSSIDELNLIKGANGKVFAIRYFGKPSPSRFQYFCFEQAKVSPSIKKGYKPGKQPLPLQAWALKQDDSVIDLPEYYVGETMGEIRIKDLMLWVNSRFGIKQVTSNIVDISGFARHGSANNFASMWQVAAAPYFLRFNGTSDSVDLGNILNDDAVSDFMIECWVRVMAVDGTLQEIAGKKNAAVNSAGFGLYRTAANKISLTVGSGTAEASAVSTNSVLTNVWKHIAAAVDRNGNIQVYINGAADGSAVSVAAIGTGTNALSYFLGRDNTNFGQVDIDMYRHYTFGAGNQPSDIATIIARHFNAERAYYGV